MQSLTSINIIQRYNIKILLFSPDTSQSSSIKSLKIK